MSNKKRGFIVYSVILGIALCFSVHNCYALEGLPDPVGLESYTTVVYEYKMDTDTDTDTSDGINTTANDAVTQGNNQNQGDEEYWLSELPANYESSILGKWYPDPHFHPNIPIYLEEYIELLSGNTGGGSEGYASSDSYSKILESYQKRLRIIDEEFNNKINNLLKNYEAEDYYENYMDILNDYTDKQKKADEEFNKAYSQYLEKLY